MAIINNSNKSLAHIGKLLSKLKFTNFEKLANCKKSLKKYNSFNLALKYADDELKDSLEQYSNLSTKKARKKRFITLTAILFSIIFCALSYFVLIPIGKLNYYESNLDNGKTAKALKSYSESNWFEYDNEVKKLFYKGGVTFVKNKDYKNAIDCFEMLKNYKDSVNYLNYSKAHYSLSKNDLNSYNYFLKCKDFLDSKKILETNKHFVILDKLQGI